MVNSPIEKFSPQFNKYITPFMKQQRYIKNNLLKGSDRYNKCSDPKRDPSYKKVKSKSLKQYRPSLQMEYDSIFDQLEEMDQKPWVALADIESELNGYVRIVEFKCSEVRQDGMPILLDVNNHAQRIMEGNMKNGRIDGFARIIDEVGNIQKGFFGPQMSY